MTTQVSGPYQVDESDLDHHGTLEKSDIGRWYVIVQGSMHFVDSKESGAALRDSLNAA